MSELMTIRDFQERYSVSRSTVYRLSERNEITFIKIGRAVRIRRHEAEDWARSLGESSASMNGANDSL